MQTQSGGRRYLHRSVNHRRSLESAKQGDLHRALVKVASVRFKAFCDRFGREPLPDEPLYFDPEADTPVQASPSEVQLQLDDACRKAGIAPSMLANVWNLARDGKWLTIGLLN
jgi:hypothetical protein